MSFPRPFRMETPQGKTIQELFGHSPQGDHFCLFYQTADDLFDALVPYFQAGLENNEFCVWVTSEPISVEEAKAAMRARVPEFDEYLENGSMEIFPYTDWYMKDGYFDAGRVLPGWIEKLKEALDSGFAGMRITGNTAWLEESQWCGFADYEAAINGVMQEELTVLCTYSLEKCGAAEIMDVVSNHGFAISKRDGEWQTIETSQNRMARQVIQEREEELRAIYDNAPLIMMLVDSERRVRKVNRFAEEFAKAESADLLKKRAGEALGCLNSLDDPEGCGFGPHCQECPVRLTIDSTFEDGISRSQIEVSRPLVADAKAADVTFLLSTSKLSVRGEPEVLITIQDITERKQIEESLRQTSEYLENLFNNANAPIVVWDPLLRITRFNRAFERLTGYEAGDVIGRELRLLFPEETREETLSRIGQTLSGEFWESVEIPIKRVDGEVRIALWNSANVYGPDGSTLLATIAQGQDITSRKRAEEALKQSVERYRSLFENMLDGFAYCRLLFDDSGEPDDFIYLAVNDAFTNLTGLENVIGKRVTEVIPGIKDSNPELFEICGRVASSGIPETCEVDFTPLGAYLFISVSSPQRGYFAVVFEDITARKQAEEAVKAERDRMEIVMENSPEANLVLLDRDFNFVSVNSTYAESCRVSKEELIGKNHFDLFPHEENEAIFRQVRDTGEAVKLKEKPFEFPGQPWRGVTYWDWSLTPVKDSWGAVQALVFSLIDVTEKVRSRQLNEALNDINLVLGSSLDFDEIMRDVMVAAAKALNAESDFLATAEDGKGWIFRYTHGAATDIPVGGSLTSANAPVAAEVLQTGETLAVSDAFADPRFDNGVLEKLSIYSSLAAPLVAKEKILGVIAFRYQSGKVEFGQAEIDFVEKLGTFISMSLENARLYQREQDSKAQMQNYATRLSVLHRIGLSLNRGTDKSKLMKTVLDGAAEITSAGIGAIILVDQGKTDLISMYYAPWYEQRCQIISDSSSLHKRIERLAGFEDRDSARISFRDLEKPLELPEGHPSLNGLLIGVLRDIRGRAVGYFMLSDKAGGADFTGEDEEIISLLAAQSSVALISAENFEREHEVADTLQAALLPDIPTREDLEVGLIYRSASSHSRLGGDFYDFIDLDDGRIAVAVGDVCGKGLEAATATAMVKYMLRAYIGDGRSAGNCLTLLNRAVAKYIEMEKFVTLGLAIMNPADESVEYSSAGHPPPIIFRRGKAMQLEFEQAVPLGVLSDYRFKTTRLVATPENALLMYTDGLIEARPPGGEPFGEAKVIETLGSYNGYPVQRAVEALIKEAVDYSGGNLRDDMAMVAVKFS